MYSSLFRVTGALCVALLVTGLAVPLAAQTLPIQYATGQAPFRMIGQPDLSTNQAGSGANQLGSISGLTMAGNTLIVSDGGLPFTTPSNNRVLIFPQFQTLGIAGSASVVVGQTDFGKTDAGISASTFNLPAGISSDGQRLAVADSNNNRILIFNQIPTANGASADVVVGQAAFNTAAPGTSDVALKNPQDVFIGFGKMIVADTLNQRVLIYNSIPTANGAKADVVLGQPDMNSGDDQAATQTSMRSPTGVFYDGTRLIVADLGHNRVLIWDQLPAANNAPANVVVGQPDFTSESVNTTATTMDFPRRAVTDGTRLFVADTGNNRVLVFNQVPAANGAAADEVLGQRDLLSSTGPEHFDPQRLSAGILSAPSALAAWNGSVIVADSEHRRVLQYTPGAFLFEQGAVVSAASYGGNGLPQVQNVQVSLKADTSSTLPAGVYYIKIVAVRTDLLFEGLPSTELKVTVPDNQSDIVVTFDEVPGATSYRAYIGGSPGGESRYFETTAPASGQPIDRTITISTFADVNSQVPQTDITPGAIQSLFGMQLSDNTEIAATLPLPTELAGTQVLVNDVPVPLFFVSPTQINFQTPFEIPGASATILVRHRQADGSWLPSVPMPVAVTNLSPAVFTVNGSGTGQLLAFHADYTPVDAGHPLVPGEVIIFYGTGVQQFESPAPQTGQAAPFTTILSTLTKSVSIQGKDAPIQYLGTAPGFVGVLQFNVKVPSDLAADVGLADVKVFVGALPANLTQLPVTGPTGTISVTPAGLVTWSVTGTGAHVYVSQNGAAPTLMAGVASGSQTPTWISPGNLYVFTVVPVSAAGVEGATLATAVLDLRTGTISVAPDGTVTWRVSGGGAANVYVSVDNGAPVLFSGLGQGSERPDWIASGHLYVFTLYARVGETQGALLATATLDLR